MVTTSVVRASLVEFMDLVAMKIAEVREMFALTGQRVRGVRKPDVRANAWKLLHPEYSLRQLAQDLADMGIPIPVEMLDALGVMEIKPNIRPQDLSYFNPEYTEPKFHPNMIPLPVAPKEETVSMSNKKTPLIGPMMPISVQLTRQGYDNFISSPIQAENIYAEQIKKDQQAAELARENFKKTHGEPVVAKSASFNKVKDDVLKDLSGKSLTDDLINEVVKEHAFSADLNSEELLKAVKSSLQNKSPKPKKEPTMKTAETILRRFETQIPSLITIHGEAIPWNRRWSVLKNDPTNDILVPGVLPHPNMDQILCPKGITIYGHCSETNEFINDGDYYLNAFEGMKVITYPLFKYVKLVEDNFQTSNMYLNDDQLKLYRQAFREICSSDKVVGISVTDKNVKIIVDEQKRGWLWWMKDLGLQFPTGNKGMKRAKPHLSGHQIVASFKEEEVKMHIYRDEKEMNLRYSHRDPNFVGPMPELKSQDESIQFLHDGPCIISRGLIVKCLKKLGINKDVKRFISMMKTKKVILRVDVPGGGMIKALAYVVPNRDMPESVDILTHNINIKKEVKNGNQWHIMMDVKRSNRIANTNTMCSDNFRDSLFREETLKLYVDSLFEKFLAELREGVFIDNEDDIESAEDEKSEAIRNSVFMMRRRSMQALQAAKLTPNCSQTILKGVVESKFRNLTSTGDRISLPIPCARYLPVISVSFAKTFSTDPNLDHLHQGQIYYLSSHDACVVSDEDWIDNTINHGGNDGDDDFYVLYRTDRVTKEKKVIVYRMPNNKGEYAVYNAFHNQDCPVSEFYYKGQKHEITWPAADLHYLPKQMSEKIRSNEMTFGSDLPTVECPHKEFTRDFCIDLVMRALSTSSAGGTMNIIMLMNHVGMNYNYLPLPMEKVLDTFMQGTDIDSLLRIEREFNAILLEIANNYSIDETFALRFQNAKDLQGNEIRFRTHEDWITRISHYITKRAGHVDKSKRFHLGSIWHQDVLSQIPFDMPWQLSPDYHKLNGQEMKRVEALFNFTTYKIHKFCTNYEQKKEWILQLFEELLATGIDMHEAVRYYAYLTHTRKKLPPKDLSDKILEVKLHNVTYLSDWILTSNPKSTDYGLWDIYIEMLITTKKAINTTKEKVEINF